MVQYLYLCTAGVLRVGTPKSAVGRTIRRAATPIFILILNPGGETPPLQAGRRGVDPYDPGGETPPIRSAVKYIFSRPDRRLNSAEFYGAFRIRGDSDFKRIAVSVRDDKSVHRLQLRVDFFRRAGKTR